MSNAARPVLAEVVRSGFVEGRHTGSVLAVRPDGERVLALGEPDQPMFPRSANKPLQAAGMLRAGLDIDGERLAIAAASHNGEPYHQALVRALLADAGLEESALANTPGLPLDEAAAADMLRAGLGPSALAANCSGKHAAMVVTCRVNGWPLAGYLDGDHPLQQAIGAGVAELAGESVAAIGVDGCGAPLHALSLAGVARAYLRLVTAEPGAAEREVGDAMRDYPHAVGGRGRAVTALMVGIPGLVAKDGAEGVFAAASHNGGAVVVKIDDGAQRAALPVLVAGLRALGLAADVLDELATLPVLGGGQPVGEVRALI